MNTASSFNESLSTTNIIRSDDNTTTSTTRPVLLSPFSLPLYQLGVALWTFYYPVLLVLGTLGNGMSLVIMRRRVIHGGGGGGGSSPSSTINIFFLALAVGDIMVLYTGVVVKWINVAFKVDVVDDWPALFYSVFTLYLMSAGFASWMLVCMTVQRAISVVRPHRVSQTFTRSRVVKLIVVVLLFQALLYSRHLFCVHVTLTTNITGSQCTSQTTFLYVWLMDHVFIYMAMVFTSVLPFTCLVIGNGVLVSSLINSVKRSFKSIVAANSELSLKRKKDSSSVTVTIVVVSATFIALTLPIYIYGAFFRFKDQSRTSVERKAQLFVVYSVSSLLMSTNSSINFYLYCLTGRRFREEFLNIIGCRAKKDAS